MAEEFGDLKHADGYVTAVMEREVAASPEEVWRMLAEEEERVKWLAPGTIDLAAGGRAALDFTDSHIVVDSEVTACEPQKLLEFSWSGAADPQRPIRFEIMPTGHGSRIRLSVSIPEDEVVARSCAGWEAHLTMMQAALAGVPIKFPFERFKECRAYFEDALKRILMSEVDVLKL